MSGKLQYFVDNFYNGWSNIFGNTYGGNAAPLYEIIMARLGASFPKSVVANSADPVYTFLTLLNGGRYASEACSNPLTILAICKSVGVGVSCPEYDEAYRYHSLVHSSISPISHQQPSTFSSSPTDSTLKVLIFVPGVQRSIDLLEKTIMLFNKDTSYVKIVCVGDKPSEQEKQKIQRHGDYLTIIEPTFSGQHSSKFFSVLNEYHQQTSSSVTFVYVTENIKEDIHIFEAFASLEKIKSRKMGMMLLNPGFPYWFCQEFSELDYSKTAKEIFAPRQTQNTFGVFKKMLEKLPSKYNPEAILSSVSHFIESGAHVYLDYKNTIKLRLETLFEESIIEVLEEKKTVSIDDLNRDIRPPQELEHIGGWLIIFLVIANCDAVSSRLVKVGGVYHLQHIGA